VPPGSSARPSCELLGAGHKVIGLARSDASAQALTEAGAAVHRGSLEDHASLRAGATSADGVIHAAFTNVSPTTDFAAACQADAAAITALGDGLAGSGKPLVVTSGTGLVAVPGRAATEDDPATWGPRVAGEEANAHFGYVAPFVSLDNPTSNERTRALLGWKPEHLGLLTDIERGGYLPA
jgi:nucleoside-diphosphate-sugar epimerase